MTVSVRSYLAVGIAAAMISAGTGAAVVSPVAAAPLPVMASPAVQLSALATALPLPAAAKPPTKPTTSPFGGGDPSDTPGQRIINSYNALEPWVQYGVDLSAWGVGFLPWPVNLAAPQMTIGYSGVSALSQAVVYSVAYAVDGQPELIGPTLKNGVQTAATNVVQGEIGWIRSYFPPLPPLGGAATVIAPKAVARAAASVHDAKPSQRKSVPAPSAAATSAKTVDTADTADLPAPVKRVHKTTRSAKAARGHSSGR